MECLSLPHLLDWSTVTSMNAVEWLCMHTFDLPSSYPPSPLLTPPSPPSTLSSLVPPLPSLRRIRRQFHSVSVRPRLAAGHDRSRGHGGDQEVHPRAAHALPHLAAELRHQGRGPGGHTGHQAITGNNHHDHDLDLDRCCDVM
jgi:hypothetical protein